MRYQTQTGFQVRSGSMDLLVRSQSLRLVHIAMPSVIVPPTRRDSGEERPAKTRRVRFADDCSSSTVASLSMAAYSSTVTETVTAPISKGVSSSKIQNLCSAGDMCSYLCADMCGGYLDTSDQLRHYLSPVCGSSCDHTVCLNKQDLGDPMPLQSIFQYPVERTLSVPDQIRLALKLVKGVLQFQSTPWLQPLWRLQDLAYFKPTDDLATALATLHISSELSHARQQGALMSYSDNNEPLGEAQMIHGIRNLTMYSLGVALLQVGEWEAALATDDVARVRRAADRATGGRLGRRYQRVIQQCLDCDFGFGKDLAAPELQNAVYRDVVCELEGLIYTLEGAPPRPS
ncbi:hypothetical protein LX32DRAFT_637980 [Colletotrichum zoysiae]|uniref:DUF7580 domain-containing protein n=1 Tax=Colletotrichum zoysiae TaxID=1216348 RepID=A0AAD9HKE4_9PEZI|nr:hypothetical protein LX32DRAFT_637980 [Colletotrichum zoysiae]